MMREGVFKKGEIYVWVRPRKDRIFPSRILCCVCKVTKKHIEVVRWDSSLKRFSKAWIDPKRLIPATEAEQRSYLSQGVSHESLQAMQA